MLQAKPYFLVKMCDQFEHPATQLQLGSSVCWVHWTVGEPMPTDLPRLIDEKLQAVLLELAPAPAQPEPFADPLAGAVEHI